MTRMNSTYVGQLWGHRWELILKATVNESTWTDAGGSTTTTVSNTPLKASYAVEQYEGEQKKGGEERWTVVCKNHRVERRPLSLRDRMICFSIP